MTGIGEPARTALTLLERAGYPSYIVGGCLRDLLLGKIPQDYDLATPATPLQMQAVFSGYPCFLQGERFGTVGVLIGGEKLEITTFRSDIGYADSRHPDQVVFSSDILDDLSRRDFTVNSIACGLDGQLVDPYGGTADIKSKILRATGDPAVRFDEDALRILRLFRFAAQLGFDIELNTLKTAIQRRAKLSAISKERIGGEFLRLLSHDCAKPLQQMSDGGILAIIGIKPITASAQIQACSGDPILRLAVLIELSGSDPGAAYSALKLSNSQKYLCGTFLTELANPVYSNKAEFKCRYSALSSEQWKTLLLAKTALGRDPGAVSDYIDQIEQNNEPYRLSQLALNGDDFFRLGYRGKEIGKVLETCLEHVIKHPQDNAREKLIYLFQK